MLPITTPNGRFRRMMTTTSWRCCVLETFQAGLSWETILNKRKRFRQAFDGFDIEPESGAMTRTRSAELTERSGHHRNRRKIVATVGNANAFRDIQTSYGSFDDYLAVR